MLLLALHRMERSYYALSAGMALKAFHLKGNLFINIFFHMLPEWKVRCPSPREIFEGDKVLQSCQTACMQGETSIPQLLL